MVLCPTSASASACRRTSTRSVYPSCDHHQGFERRHDQDHVQGVRCFDFPSSSGILSSLCTGSRRNRRNTAQTRDASYNRGRDVVRGYAHPGCWHGPRGPSQIAFVLKATARGEDGGPHGIYLCYILVQARQEPHRAGPVGPTPGPDLQSCGFIMMVRRIDVFGCSLDCLVGLSECVHSGCSVRVAIMKVACYRAVGGASVQTHVIAQRACTATL